MSADLISVVEAAYELGEGISVQTWIQRILEALRPSFDRGMGVGAIVQEREPARFVAAVGLGMPEGWQDLSHNLMASDAGPGLLRPRRPASTASDALGASRLSRNRVVREKYHPLGVFDAAGIVGTDGSGTTITFIALMAEIGSLNTLVAQRYEQVVAHVLAAWRLRQSLGRSPLAVLSPSGAVLDGTGAATRPAARDNLRAAARAMDRARSRARTHDDALALWPALVAGEWSIVDSFDSDGRRFLVVHKNDPNIMDPRALTLRERQVLALVASGHALKLIAYELGLSISTIAEHRANAMRKLRLRSPLDVVRLFSPRS